MMRKPRRHLTNLHQDLWVQFPRCFVALSAQISCGLASQAPPPAASFTMVPSGFRAHHNHPPGLLNAGGSSVRFNQERKRNLMELLWTLLIGLLVGIIAKFLMPGRDPGG